MNVQCNIEYDDLLTTTNECAVQYGVCSVDDDDEVEAVAYVQTSTSC